VSLPLHPTIAGAADFYLEDDDALEAINIEDAAVITDQVAAALRLAQVESSPWEPVDGMALPPWLTSSGTRDRMAVWVAMGIVMHGADINSADALALLRAYAFGHNLDLDATAAQLVHGGLSVEDLA
jgi:hypothetical protein